MGYLWYKEEQNDPLVREASELAKKARDCYHKSENVNGAAVAEELKKAIGYIKQIDRLFSDKPADYDASFYAYYAIDDVALNIAIYYKATKEKKNTKHYKEAKDYATRGYVLASRASRKDDTDYIRQFEICKQLISEAEWKESPAGMAATRKIKFKKTLEKLETVAGFGFIILLILTSILGIYCGIKMISIPVILCVLYCITGMMLGFWCSYEHVTGGFFSDRVIPYLFFGGSIIVVMLLQFMRVKTGFGDREQITMMVLPVIVKIIFNFVGMITGLMCNKIKG